MSDGHSLTFSGSGYVKYHLLENENKELMKLSLRLRTFSSHATVMYAKGTDYSILEVCLCVCVCVNLFYQPYYSAVIIHLFLQPLNMINSLILIRSRLIVPLHFLANPCITTQHFHIRRA